MEKKNTCIRVYADPRQIADGKQKLQAVAGAVFTLSRLLNLCGNEVRLQILYLLYVEEQLCPCDLSDMLGMSIPAVATFAQAERCRPGAHPESSTDHFLSDCTGAYAAFAAFFRLSRKHIHS